MQDERYSAIECILFVSGEPVSLVQLQRALDITGIEMNANNWVVPERNAPA